MFETSLNSSSDPVADKVSWEPARGGGANFRTQKLVRQGQQAVISPSLGGKAFALAFLLPGLGVLFGLAPWLLLKGEYFPGAFLVVWGLGFAGGGWLILHTTTRTTFDKQRGMYFMGKAPQAGGSRVAGKQGLLMDIHALQCLSERITGNKGGSYRSYELNLVFHDGTRLNVMDHGAKMVVELAAEELSQFLNVPVWHARDRASV
ncbi:hypothetical protein [Chitinimonas sp. BJYL2]|uniref:hypothetical protein n=1 Tax=Chitinimonas sp. BJYL2 TaxID=2976696 RepID=UPI0022B4E696|nr:hypothetical protein [Chitinimonas sp. BJYL2]